MAGVSLEVEGVSILRHLKATVKIWLLSVPVQLMAVTYQEFSAVAGQ